MSLRVQLGNWREDWRKAPNVISLVRIVLCLAPGLVLLVGRDDPMFWWIALASFAFVAATDAVDGFVARRLNQTTELGKVLDPLADKLLVVFSLLFICVVYTVRVEWGWALWLVVAFIALRETVVTFKIRGPRVVAAVRSGKIKMVAQCAMIVSLFVPFTGWWTWLVQWPLIIFAVIMTAVSWIDYVRRFA